MGTVDPEEPDTADFTVARRDASGVPPVGIVLLLPDGRWQVEKRRLWCFFGMLWMILVTLKDNPQELSMPKLDLRFPSAESLKMCSSESS